MRLHRLELTAFGPFAGTQSVDFDELSAAGLFLLHGPTGAGKTSVLDGVCFALYGQVPGARPATRLRSDHAAPGTATEVVLELTLGGRRLEITRRPEQLRAKKRGTGLTPDKAVTLLREFTGGTWHGLSKSHQEVGEELRQLIGMSCEQFCQVVLLPQGEFATFLRAGSVERAALLGKLFDTRRFKAVEHWLRDGKIDAERLLAHGDRDLALLAATMRQAAGPGSDLAPGAPGAPDFAGGTDPADPASLLSWAAALRCDAREHHDIARTALSLAEQSHATASAAADAARDLHALQTRHAATRRRADSLAAELPARTAARGALARARRAATVRPALELRDTAAARHDEAAARERRMTAELTAAGEPTADHRVPGARDAAADLRTAGEPRDDRRPGPGGVVSAGDVRRTAGAREGTVDVDRTATSTRPRARDGVVHGQTPQELARRAGELREILGALARAGEAEARVREIRERRASLDREERDDADTAREAGAWLEAWPVARAALQERLDRALEAVGQAAGLAGELETARRRRDAAAERDTLVRDSARAGDAARDARDRAAAARERWQDLREARIAGIAAELAAGLTGGEPCRVCGSPDHPAPARPTAQQVTRADEDAASAVFGDETAGYERAQERAARLRAALETATATAGNTPQAELAAACAVLEADHAEAVREAAVATDARGALRRAEGERDRRSAHRERALSAIAARTSRREELDAEHERLSAELDRARAGHAGVADRRDRLSARIALLDRAAQAVRDRAESADRLAAAEAALVAAADGAGFASPAEAAAALLPPAELADGERRAEAWAGEEAAAAADLASPAEAAAALLPPADPERALTALEAATRRLRDASSAESAAASRSAELDLLGTRAADRVRELAPARTEFTRIKRLSDLASANTAENRYRMELETYVLAARLEQVAAAAGVRLQRMSAGRYTLVHTDARGGGRSKSGLGLMVVDAWTGTERDTSTLSGGETFFASLALALGLADVVTDEAGGTRLDTLFIDEGFGSLDEQTLDEVLDVLDGLRERDRAVGIVSHVADLRHRIPAQLKVVKGRDGSSVRMCTGSGASAASHAAAVGA